MPITTHENEAARYGNDNEHWKHVMEHLFVPAIEEAGYVPIRPVSKGASMIHGEIVRHLSEADMVLCDFSGLNANVFFELGVRTSLNLPVALVRDEHTKIPFDLGGMNTHEYRSTIDIWTNKSETSKLTTHITDCHDTCKGVNPLWERFGLSIKAEEPSVSESPAEAKMDLLLSEISELREVQRETQRSIAIRDHDREYKIVRGPTRNEVSVYGPDESGPYSESQHQFKGALRRWASKQGLTLPPKVEFFMDGTVKVTSTEIFEKDREEAIQTLALHHGLQVELMPF